MKSSGSSSMQGSDHGSGHGPMSALAPHVPWRCNSRVPVYQERYTCPIPRRLRCLQVRAVTAQIMLAEQIASLPGYQNYLVSIRQIEAGEKIGIAQAAALEHADVKVIANTGASAEIGRAGVGELFSAKGGQAIGSMLESLVQSPA